jgi:hypothetical protein
VCVSLANLIRFNCVAESHNVSANGRADILLAERRARVSDRCRHDVYRQRGSAECVAMRQQRTDLAEIAHLRSLALDALRRLRV